MSSWVLQWLLLRCGKARRRDPETRSAAFDFALTGKLAGFVRERGKEVVLPANCFVQSPKPPQLQWTQQSTGGAPVKKLVAGMLLLAPMLLDAQAPQQQPPPTPPPVRLGGDVVVKSLLVRIWRIPNNQSSVRHVSRADGNAATVSVASDQTTVSRIDFALR